MIPPYHGVFNNVNPVGERGDIALRGVSRNVLTHFFPTPLPFFTLQNLTSGWNSIAIRSLTDRPISRDLIRAGIFRGKRGKRFEDVEFLYYISIGEIICELLWIPFGWFCNPNSLSWTVSSISILSQIFKKIKSVTLLLWIFLWNK